MIELLSTALVVAAFAFVGCALFLIPLLALMDARKPLREGLQLAAVLAPVGLLAGFLNYDSDPVDLFTTSLFIAAAGFVGCAAFYMPLAALTRGRLRDGIQLAAGLAILAFLGGMMFGPTWQHSDADAYPEKTCSGRQC